MEAVECIPYWHHAIELEPGLVQALDPENNVWFFKSCEMCCAEVITQDDHLKCICPPCVHIRQLKSNAEYEKSHKEQICARKKEYYSKNRDRICARRREVYRQKVAAGFNWSQI